MNPNNEVKLLQVTRKPKSVEQAPREPSQIDGEIAHRCHSAFLLPSPSSLPQENNSWSCQHDTDFKAPLFMLPLA